MEILRHFFSELVNLIPLLGLSVVGLVTVVWQVVAWLRDRIGRRIDKRRLGEHYATWKRLAEQSHLDKARGSITRAIDSTKLDLGATAVASLKKEISARLDRSASGTIDLTYKDLLTTPGLIIPIHFIDTQGNVVAFLNQDERPPFPVAQGALSNTPVNNLLVGPAGTGKSLLCRSLEYRWATKVDPSIWLITIGPTDFVEGRITHGGGGVGSREWLISALADRWFEEPLSAFEKRAFAELLDEHARILVDGVDEIADLLRLSEMENFLKSWVVARAEVSTVRTSYFESAISTSPAAGRFRVAFCEEATEARIIRFVVDLCERIYPQSEARSRVAVVQEIRERAPDLRELTHNPLLLTMVVSLRNLTPGVRRVDVSTVYREFVRQSLVRDKSVRETNLSVDTVIEILCEFAWIRFRQVGNAAMGKSSLLAAVSCVPDIEGAARRAAAEAIESCPLLTLEPPLATSHDEFNARFYHKSFEDYFVARRVEDWLFGRSQRGEDFFDYIETPEVTFFVKESTLRLADQESARRQAADRLRQALWDKLHSRREVADERTARTMNFAAGQIAYYLGMIGDTEIKRSLEDAIAEEPDFWVKRCGVIGLAFGGEPKMFHEFIDQMRSEIEADDFTSTRKNIGVELGFYGDQDFDRLDPTRDAGGDSCKHTVGRSLLELRLDVEAANWRMILFNLLYLARYRAPECFYREIAERKDELRKILLMMAVDPNRAKYPEISELLGILDG